MDTACVAFAFGVPSNTEANQRIAKIALGIDIPSYPGIYTQRDINIDAIKELCNRDRMQVTYTPERPGYPPPTLRLARGAVNWAIANSVTTLYIACAYPYLWRCRRDLNIAIKEKGANIKVKLCFGTQLSYKASNWFNTRDEKYFCYIHEAILRIMPVWLYKKIAS